MQAQGKAFAKVMRKDGVCYVPDVLTPEQADALREWITGFRGQAEQDVSGGVPLTYRFADVLLRQNRADLKMPIGQPLVMDALTSILSQDKGVLGHMATELLGGDPELYELSCLISDPGSQRQIVHADTPYGGQGGLDGDSPVIFTFFIALQDVKEDMGATVWLPGTHTRKAHDIFAGKEKDELLRTAPIRLGMLPKGCMGAFDSRLLHCGGANRSGDSRAIFYLSFKNAKVANAGNPGSISPELVGALRLSTLQKELGVREEVGNSDALDKIVAQMR